MNMLAQLNTVKTSRLAHQQDTVLHELNFVCLKNMQPTLTSIIPKCEFFRVKHVIKSAPFSSDFQMAMSGKP